MKEAVTYVFSDFITDLEMITAHEKDEHEKIKKISRRLKILLNSGDFLTDPEKQPKDEKYARHIVHVDRERRFVVVSLVWSSGQGTPVHDHGTWGVAGVVTNELKVTNYYRTDDRSKEGHAELREAFGAVASAGSVSYVLPPNEEIHKMDNISDKTTISLHVYGKEIHECNMYDLEAKSYKQLNLSYTNMRHM